MNAAEIKTWRRKAKRLGLCGRCCRRRPDDGMKTCESCLASARKGTRKYTRCVRRALTESEARALVRLQLGPAPIWTNGMITEFAQFNAYRRAYMDRFEARMAAHGFPVERPTEWTEAEKEADRRAEAEEMGWLGWTCSAMNKPLAEAVERDDADEAWLFELDERRAA